MSSCSPSRERPKWAVLLVDDYGAKGDGRTNDTNSIRAALDAARNLGVPVRLAPGRIYRATDLDVTGCYFDLAGSTIMAPDGSNRTSILVSGGACHVVGGTLNGNSEGSIAKSDPRFLCAIRVTAERGWKAAVQVRSLKITGTHGPGIRISTGGSISKSITAPTSPVVIQGVEIEGATSGIHLNQLRAPIIRDCTITKTSGNGIFVQLTYQLRIESNVIEFSGRHGVTVLYCDGAVVSDNRVTGSTRSGIVFGGGISTRQPNRKYVVTSNACIRNGDSGITCDPTVVGKSGMPIIAHGLLEENICDSNGKHGIVLTCAKFMRLVENECSLNDGSGIALSTSNTVLVENICNGNRRFGVAIFGGPRRPNYGHHRLEDNNGSGNLSGKVFVQSPSITSVVGVPTR